MSGQDMDAIYCRWSGHKKAKDDDIESQLLKTRARSAADGREVYKEYTDMGISGAISKRRGLDALLSDAIAHRFTRVIMTHPDRLSRGEEGERGMFEGILRRADVAVIYTDYQKQDTPEGQMADDVLSVFARYERKRIAQRMDEKRQAKIDAGHPWRGKDPYGWHYVRPTGKAAHGHFEQVPAQAAIVADIFAQVASGASGYAVASGLNARGVPGPSGGRWSRVVIHKLLHNPIHCGRVATNRYYAVKPDTPRDAYNAERARSTRQRPMDEWKYTELDQRIVSTELWEQVQAQLASNKKFSRRNARHDYLLTRLVRCGQPVDGQPGTTCDRLMYGAVTAAGTKLYRCNRGPSSDATQERCCRGRVMAADVEGRVWDWVQDAFLHPDTLQAHLEQARAGAGQRRHILAEQLAAAHARHNALQAKLDSLLLASLEPGADPTTYARVEAQLVAQRDSTAAEVTRLEEQLASLQAHAFAWDDFTVFASNALHELLHLTLHADDAADGARGRFIRTLVESVQVRPDGSLALGVRLPTLGEGTGRVILTPTPCCWRHNPAPPRFTVVLPVAA